MLLLLADGTQVPVTELPGTGPWTFVVLGLAGPAEPGAGGAAGLLTRFGRAVVPDLRDRPGWGEPPGTPGFLDLVDDLDQLRTRAGLGRPVLVGVEGLVPAAVQAAADQPWAWRALLLVPRDDRAVPADVDRVDLPVLVVDAVAGQVEAVAGLLGRLGGGPGWAGIAPDASPR